MLVFLIGLNLQVPARVAGHRASEDNLLCRNPSTLVAELVRRRDEFSVAHVDHVPQVFADVDFAYRAEHTRAVILLNPHHVTDADVADTTTIKQMSVRTEARTAAAASTPTASSPRSGG